jgi:hypothetical protein
VTFGGGRKAPGGRVRIRSTSASKRDLDRQGSVVGRSWRSDQAIRHLFLEHQRRIGENAPLVRPRGAA